VARLVASRYHPQSMTRTTRSLSLLVLASALIVLLLVLGPNLHRIELRPGTPDLSPLAEVETTTSVPGTASTGAGAFDVFLRVLMIAALASLAFIVVGSIFSRELRAYLLLFVVLFLMVLAFYHFFANRPRPEVEPQTLEVPAAAWMDHTAAPADEGTSEPPAWSVSAIAIGISIGIAILLAIAWATLAPRWRRRAGSEDKTGLEELIETVGNAADEIQLGGDPRSAVLRCYREMIRILCRNQAIDYAPMTPRELAAMLYRAGFTVRHVDQLTEIFESVRYGNRSGQPLAEQAINCLDAIREAYAA